MPQPMHLPPEPGGSPVPPDRPAPRPSPVHRSRTVDEDSTGRPLAMRLPDWDLLPPTEFLTRPRGR